MRQFSLIRASKVVDSGTEGAGELAADVLSVAVPRRADHQVGVAVEEHIGSIVAILPHVLRAVPEHGILDGFTGLRDDPLTGIRAGTRGTVELVLKYESRRLRIGWWRCGAGTAGIRFAGASRQGSDTVSAPNPCHEHHAASIHFRHGNTINDGTPLPALLGLRCAIWGSSALRPTPGSPPSASSPSSSRNRVLRQQKPRRGRPLGRHDHDVDDDVSRPPRPQLGYTLDSWEVLWNTYVPLLTYRHAKGEAGTDVVPGLAKDMPANLRRRHDVQAHPPPRYEVLRRHTD